MFARFESRDSVGIVLGRTRRDVGEFDVGISQQVLDVVVDGAAEPAGNAFASFGVYIAGGDYLEHIFFAGNFVAMHSPSCSAASYQPDAYRVRFRHLSFPFVLSLSSSVYKRYSY